MKAILVGLLILVVAVVGIGLWTSYAPDRPRGELEARYHVVPSDYVEVAGIRLHVVASGPPEAPAVILLHGFGSSLYTWDAWAERLATDLRVVRLDLPGFGLTGPDPTGDYSDDRALALLVGLMDRLGLARASLVGHSLGGRIAWTFASRHPERVDRLVLIAPDGFASPGVAYGRIPEVPRSVRLLPYILPEPLLRASLVPAFADPRKLTGPMLARYRDMLLAPGVRSAMVDRMGQVRLVDPVPLLRQIEAPTLLLWGRKDAMIPFANAADYLAALPHATLSPLDGLGHVPFEEAPEVALEPLRRFLLEGRTTPP